MAANDPVVLSVVVMHHPSRHDRIPALLAACDPLPVRVVVDPDPGGPRSPLRTAKRAWAAIAPGATHHVVLQDDILPMAGFAEHLHQALAARPADGVTLSVQQTSPRNSYAVRRAAVAGHPFAELSAVEWTPTLALALPMAHAEALARYLAGVPDSYVDDDHLVTSFCAERGIAVLATVPNLVEHADVVSLSPYGNEGRRPVTVYDEHWKPPPAWWDGDGRSPVPAPERAGAGGLAVELRESRCGLRPLSAGDPPEHPFTWEWRDHAGLAGVRAEQVVAEWRAARAQGDPEALSAALSLEVWAAAFLLGADLHRSGTTEADDADFVPALRRRAVLSWLEMGLSGRDRRALTVAGWDALVEFATLAADTGTRTAAQAPAPTIRSGAAADPAGLDGVLRRMAEREAAALRRQPVHTTWLIAPEVRVSVRPLPCPWCGAGAGTANPAGLEPMDQVRMLEPDEPPAPGSVLLHALACEWLTARSVLPLVQPGRDQPPPELLTRAAAAAEIMVGNPDTALPDLLSEVDERESWLPAPGQHGNRAGRPWVLPASSRPAPAADTDIVSSHFLTPHRTGLVPATLAETYRRYVVNSRA
ncbi:MAG TPA: hypothetical protein VFV67_27160 [Actinophytocola sp.]|uniref:hypothetical protein n=1 Tax=Actinophytocola sp. TaxID=1872138 RepID=UPI002DBE295F|nr:hypothetical protein [Actinophytocola sp.]HEU5474343.1 hypothetical protein [Actinophytocola sp.]